jgi:hypothetical protein
MRRGQTPRKGSAADRAKEDFKRLPTALGRFSMLGLPPGYFKQFSWEPADGVNYNDPDYVELYENHGMRVHIEERRQ